MPEPQRRRLYFRLTVAVGVVFAGVLTAMLLTNSLQTNDSYSSIGAFLLGLVTTFATVALVFKKAERPVQLDTAAADLVRELREQWDTEIRHRREQSGDARTIPLTWKEAPPTLAADPATVLEDAMLFGGVRLKLSGRLDDNPDTAAKKLAAAFDEIPSRRLVVIGEPGSGKTFLGITLTTGLLRRWRPGEPIPVFLSLTSWDPVTEPLESWIIRELATTHYGGQEQIPRSLFTHPRLLPVLDGLDELPEHLRRSAIGGINATLQDNRPLILTCRSVEYADEIRGGAPKLLRAPVVEISPISAADLRVQLAQDPAWSGVPELIDRNPDTPVTAALGTPLMLSLFKSAYAGRDPAELFDRKRFGTRHAVEDHLIDAMIEAAYSVDVPGGGRSRRRHSGAQARRWLTYLAGYLHQHGDRELSWWQLAPRTLSPWTAAAVGLPIGFAAAIATTILDDAILSYDREGGLAWEIVRAPSTPGVIFGAVAASLWLVGARRTTERRQPTPERGWRHTVRTALTGAALMFLPCFLLWLIWTDGGTAKATTSSTVLFGALLALSLVSGAAISAPDLLVRRSRRSVRPDPSSILRQERRSALWSATITAVIVATTTVPATTLIAALAGHLGERIALLQNLPSAVTMHLPPIQTHVPWLLGFRGLPSLFIVSVLLGALFATGVLVTRAWPRFLVARLRLAIRRKLPWRLMDFLADARRRGVLRLAGGSYQFFHVRLQERLVATPRDLPGRTSRRWVVLATVTSMAVAATAIVAIISVEPAGCRPVGIGHVDDHIERMVIGDASGCFATLTEAETDELATSQADRRALAELRTADHPLRSYYRIAMTGEFDRISTLERSQMFAGLAAAEQALGADLLPTFVQKETGELRDIDSNSLTAEYTSERLVDPGGISLQYSGILDFDSRRSTLPTNSIGIKMLLAPANLDFAYTIIEWREYLVRSWFDYGHEYATIADSISDEACSLINQVRQDELAARIDFRRAHLTAELMHRAMQCGGTSALVTSDQVEQIRPLTQGTDTMRVYAITDKSQSILSDCANFVQPNTLAMQTCVAALAEVDQFRVEINSIDQEGFPVR